MQWNESLTITRIRRLSSGRRALVSLGLACGAFLTAGLILWAQFPDLSWRKPAAGAVASLLVMLLMLWALLPGLMPRRESAVAGPGPASSPNADREVPAGAAAPAASGQADADAFENRLRSARELAAADPMCAARVIKDWILADV